MFGLKTNKIDTLLGQGAEFRGNIVVEGSIVIDGRMEGNITASGRITVGRHGNVKGNLASPEGVVGGKLSGNIVCTERVELLAGGQVTGDIHAPILVMAEGALVSGTVGMEAATVELRPELRVAKK